MLIHMLPTLASRRACASSTIEIKALKAVVNFETFFEDGDEVTISKKEEEAKERFWRVLESF